jgi:hypothetical protein
MKAEDIIKQMQLALPNNTDYFTDTLDITSLTRSGSTVTAVCATPHNLETGKNVRISGAKAPTLITELTQVNGVATAKTDVDHDLTEEFFETVEIIGADQEEYNGTFSLLRVQNRLTFSYGLNSASVISPATGSEILLLTAGLGSYNGLFTVTVIDPVTFTYQINTTPYPTAYGNIKAKKNIRISGAVSIDRALEAYTSQETNKLWAFVVLDDTQVSKDRTQRNDSIALRSYGVDFRTRLLKNFSVYVVVPSVMSVAGRYERDLMEDLEPLLYKSLLGVKFESPFAEKSWSLITPVGHGFSGYYKAYYVHRFQFQTSYDILIEDTAINPETRAFRDITLNYYNFEEGVPGEIIASADVDLDDEPLS